MLSKVDRKVGRQTKEVYVAVLLINYVSCVGSKHTSKHHLHSSLLVRRLSCDNYRAAQKIERVNLKYMVLVFTFGPDNQFLFVFDKSNQENLYHEAW